MPARGSVRPVIHDMLKHLCSAISYGGARSLGELQEMFRKDPERYVIRLTSRPPRVIRADSLPDLFRHSNSATTTPYRPPDWCPQDPGCG